MTVLSEISLSGHARLPRPTPQVVLAAALALSIGATLLGGALNWRTAALYGVGGALGFVLYQSAFGFTSAWRALIADGRGTGFRAQMLMLALATILFFPALAAGSLFGMPVAGAVAPVGVSVLVGAFLFGVGMQLGGGCASGTLYTAGGGNVRMLVTLVAFISGSLVGTAHLPWWLARPSLGEISMLDRLGWLPALLLQLGTLAAIAALSWLVELLRHGAAAEGNRPRTELVRLALGPWPLLWGAVGLAALNFLTLVIAGQPWGVTFAFSLWGAKIAATLGVDVASWEFWTWPYARDALHDSVFADVTSVMDFGIMAGALLAAGLRGKFAPVLRIAPRSLLAAVIGGLLMGYGARLAFGCNIGAFFSGVVSGSLHGWLWFVAALVGTVIGTRLRPLFGLAVERPGTTDRRKS